MFYQMAIPRETGDELQYKQQEHSSKYHQFSYKHEILDDTGTGVNFKWILVRESQVDEVVNVDIALGTPLRGAAPVNLDTLCW
jgi:hypothetical protein